MSKKNQIRPQPSVVTPPLIPQGIFQTQSITYQGQLPVASELQKYEELCPGTTDRLIKMNEQRLEMEKAEQAFAHLHIPIWKEEELKTHKRYQIIGFIALGACILGTAWFMQTATSWQERMAAGLFLGIPTTAVIRSFKK